MKNTFRFALILLVLLSAPLFSAEKIELIGGNLKLILNPHTGTMCLYHLADVGKNRYEPLIEDRNYGSTSWFSVQLDGKVFKLAPRSGKPVESLRTIDGAVLRFTLTEDFYIEQEFKLVDPDGRGYPTAVSMELRIENTSGKSASFAVKGLFDTMLGETEGIHFFTDLKKRISHETKIILETDRDSYLVSQGEQQSFVFNLRAYTPPETLFIANWDRLNTLTWLPDFIEGRSFNTLYSVQDSAVLFLWPQKTIKPNELYTVQMLFGPYLIKKSTVSTFNPEITSEPKTEDERQALIQWILVRIDQIEANPSCATDQEMDYLNRTLDGLLKQRMAE